MMVLSHNASFHSRENITPLNPGTKYRFTVQLSWRGCRPDAGADLWAYQKGGVLDFSRPGKPTDNSFIESFNGKFRAKYLNTHWFMSLGDARAKMEAWRQDYNGGRPHSTIGNKQPISLLNGSGHPSEGPLHDPAAGQNFEAPGPVPAPDDLDDEVQIGCLVHQLEPVVGTVGE